MAADRLDVPQAITAGGALSLSYSSLHLRPMAGAELGALLVMSDEGDAGLSAANATASLLLNASTGHLLADARDVAVHAASTVRQPRADSGV